MMNSLEKNALRAIIELARRILRLAGSLLKLQADNDGRTLSALLRREEHERREIGDEPMATKAYRERRQVKERMNAIGQRVISIPITFNGIDDGHSMVIVVEEGETLLDAFTKANEKARDEAHSRFFYDRDRNKPLDDGLCKACGFALSYAVKIGHYCANENCTAPIDLTKATKLRLPLLDLNECPYHGKQAKWLLNFIAQNRTTINQLLK